MTQGADSGTGLSVVFRTDSSNVIGSGHVMRCLVLADALRETGAHCRFICAELSGALMEHIVAEGFDVAPLAAPLDDLADPSDYASWAGLAWEEDARQSARLLEDWAADWLVVDHYGLDARWERAVKPPRAKTLVLDDLANRPHHANVLLDQNFGRVREDYEALVPKGCVMRTGPQHAWIRPACADLRAATLASRPSRRLRHILVAMGGVDLADASSAILDALAPLPLPKDVAVTLVMGRSAPHLARVRERAAQMPFPCAVVTGVTNMHELMADADLAIGAVGGTAWERCVLGLPTLMLTVADNQIPAANALDSAGAAVQVGDVRVAGWQEKLATTLAAAREGTLLQELSKASAHLTDGRGTDNLVQLIVADDDQPR